jgi:signal transduction histidine kinase
MKYFYKLFLSIVLILTAALAAVEYTSVSYSLGRAFDRERESVLNQHQLVKYSVQAAVLSAANAGAADGQEMQTIGRAASALLEPGGQFALADGSGRRYFSTLSAEDADEPPAEGKIRYRVEKDADGRTLLLAQSRFSQSGQSLALTTARDISGVFSEAAALRARCTRIYFAVLGAGALAALVLAWLLTRPLDALRRTSREFASGKYQARSRIRTHDEVRELSDAYNRMADALEGKIRELEDIAERQQTFTANFAHELKTPMTSIIGYADTIYQKNLPPDEVRQSAWYIMNEGMRLEALSFKLMDLLSLNRTNFTLEQTEIENLLADTRDTIAPAAQKRGVLLTCSWEAGWVRVEYDLFKTLLLNLLDNALKSGGTQVGLYGQKTDGVYRISVTDNGRGIPPDELARITEAFYMVDKSRSRKEHGAGLGLALAARIAEIHHTKLDYASRPGTGTMVTVALAAEEGGDE